MSEIQRGQIPPIIVAVGDPDQARRIRELERQLARAFELQRTRAIWEERQATLYHRSSRQRAAMAGAGVIAVLTFLGCGGFALSWLASSPLVGIGVVAALLILVASIRRPIVSIVQKVTVR